MNAQEAKNKADQAQLADYNRQYDLLKKQINQASESGKYSITVGLRLIPKVKYTLEEEGFKLEEVEIGFWSVKSTIISWSWSS